MPSVAAEVRLFSLVKEGSLHSVEGFLEPEGFQGGSSARLPNQLNQL